MPVHVPFCTRYVNPRIVWCCSDEDFMGKVRPLVSSSVRGKSMWGAIAKALEKYVRALDMFLQDPAIRLKGTA